MVLGYMFRPHCCHLQANLYRLSALNMRAICVVYDVKIYMLFIFQKCHPPKPSSADCDLTPQIFFRYPKELDIIK